MSTDQFHIDKKTIGSIKMIKRRLMGERMMEGVIVPRQSKHVAN